MHKGTQVILAALLALCTLCGMSFTAAAASPEQEKKPIIVGVSNHPYDLDMVHAIAREMDLDIQIRPLPSNMLMWALKNGDIDISAHAAYTESRAREFDFSPVYLTEHLSLYGRNDSPYVSSIKGWQNLDVMLPESQALSEIAIEEGWRRIAFADSDDDMLRMLNAGNHDYAVVDARLANHYIVTLGLDNIGLASPEHIVLEYCYAVKKGNSEVLAPFIEGLAVLNRTGLDKRIHNEWFGYDVDIGGMPWRQIIRYGGIAAVVVFVVMLHIFVWSMMLRKQVTQRTAELALEIKERKRVEDELLRNQEHLVQAEKLAAIGTLVSGVAHEINNPNGLILMNVTMFSQMDEDIRRITDEYYAQKGDFEVGKWRYSEVRDGISQMMTETVDASKRIVRLVEELKNYSHRVDPVLNEAVNLNVVAESAIRLVNAAIKESTECFVTRYAENLPDIWGNSQRIEQIVVNLVLNACQALPDRGKGIELTTRFDPDDKTVILEIKDEGIGIGQQHMRYITDPFYTTKREQGGTGLGLSVSSTIVKEHGGHLVLRSAEGEGTTATVSFPIA